LLVVRAFEIGSPGGAFASVRRGGEALSETTARRADSRGAITSRRTHHPTHNLDSQQTNKPTNQQTNERTNE
jgi:hypothetical protein